MLRKLAKAETDARVARRLLAISRRIRSAAIVICLALPPPRP
jgi:hypothetical protein